MHIAGFVQHQIEINLLCFKKRINPYCFKSHVTKREHVKSEHTRSGKCIVEMCSNTSKL